MLVIDGTLLTSSKKKNSKSLQRRCGQKHLWTEKLSCTLLLETGGPIVRENNKTTWYDVTGDSRLST